MANSPHCIRCKKKPGQFLEYREAARNDHPPLSPDEFVRREEGTYNPENNLFACTECYIELGEPSLPGFRGWKAGDPIPKYEEEEFD